MLLYNSRTMTKAIHIPILPQSRLFAPSCHLGFAGLIYLMELNLVSYSKDPCTVTLDLEVHSYELCFMVRPHWITINCWGNFSLCSITCEVIGFCGGSSSFQSTRSLKSSDWKHMLSLLENILFHLTSVGLPWCPCYASEPDLQGASHGVINHF